MLLAKLLQIPRHEVGISGSLRLFFASCEFVMRECECEPIGTRSSRPSETHYEDSPPTVLGESLTRWPRARPRSRDGSHSSPEGVVECQIPTSRWCQRCGSLRSQQRLCSSLVFIGPQLQTLTCILSSLISSIIVKAYSLSLSRASFHVCRILPAEELVAWPVHGLGINSGTLSATRCNLADRQPLTARSLADHRDWT